MQGVEILNTTYKYASLIAPTYILQLMLVCIIIGVIGILTIDYEKIQKIVIVFFVAGAIGTIVSVIGAFIPTDRIADTRYQVTVSDEVTLNEFYEHYEVIAQDGKIFTVREK
jgi:hypothetical protein